MKKVLSLVLALAMITGTLAMVSCSNGEGDTTTTAGTTTKASDKTTAPDANKTDPAPETSDPFTGDEFDDFTGFAVGDEELAAMVGSSVNLMENFFVRGAGYNTDLSFAKGLSYPEGESDLGDEGPHQLFNGDEQFDDSDRKWCVGKNDVEWCSAIVWSMTQEVTATHYVFRTANDSAKYQRAPIAWRLYGTNEDITKDEIAEKMKMNDDYFDTDTVPEGWTLIDKIASCTTFPDENFVNVTFPIKTPKAYKHYMLLFEMVEDMLQLSELKLYGNAG